MFYNLMRHFNLLRRMLPHEAVEIQGARTSGDLYEAVTSCYIHYGSPTHCAGSVLACKRGMSQHWSDGDLMLLLLSC